MIAGAARRPTPTSRIGGLFLFLAGVPLRAPRPLDSTHPCQRSTRRSRPMMPARARLPIARRGDGIGGSRVPESRPSGRQPRITLDDPSLDRSFLSTRGTSSVSRRRIGVMLRSSRGRVAGSPGRERGPTSREKAVLAPRCMLVIMTASGWRASFPLRVGLAFLAIASGFAGVARGDSADVSRTGDRHRASNFRLR